MGDKNDVLKAILDTGIVAVIRTPETEQARQLAEAACRGGIRPVEITMSIPGALELIRELSSGKADGEMIVGVGTVMDAEMARLAILAGAEYVVSPHFNPDVVAMCRSHHTVCIPGAMSVKEIVDVIESGADAIKIFPAGLLSPEFIREVSAPLPQAMMIPSGGVTLDNAGKWLEAGAVALFVGGELTAEALATGDYSITERIAREFVSTIRQTRQKLKGSR